MKIADREIGNRQPVFVIAEAGINHNGDIKRAHSLIRAAADAQADAVKFQAFSADRLINRGGDYDQLKMCELSKTALQELRPCPIPQRLHQAFQSLGRVHPPSFAPGPHASIGSAVVG